MPSGRLRRWARFLLGGCANTGATYALYLVLAIRLHHQVAYFAAYAAGILFAYWVNSRFVFKTAMSLKSLAAYPLVYVAGYALSAILLEVCIRGLGLNKNLAPLVVVTAMVPVTYLLNKAVLMRRGAERRS